VSAVLERREFHDVDDAIRRVLREEPGSTTNEVMEATGIAADRLLARLQAGKEKGLLQSRLHVRGEKREWSWWIAGGGL
jgi:hypothetical protein